MKLLWLLLLHHPKRLRMILCSVCALAGRQTSSTTDAPRSSFRRSASKAVVAASTLLVDSPISLKGQTLVKHICWTCTYLQGCPTQEPERNDWPRWESLRMHQRTTFRTMMSKLMIFILIAKWHVLVVMPWCFDHKNGIHSPIYDDEFKNQKWHYFEPATYLSIGHRESEASCLSFVQTAIFVTYAG